MIKCEVNGKVEKLSVSGNLASISAEVLAIINQVYSSLKEQDEKSAEEFRMLMSLATVSGAAFIESEDDFEEALKTTETIFNRSMKDESKHK